MRCAPQNGDTSSVRWISLSQRVKGNFCRSSVPFGSHMFSFGFQYGNHGTPSSPNPQVKILGHLFTVANRKATPSETERQHPPGSPLCVEASPTALRCLGRRSGLIFCPSKWSVCVHHRSVRLSTRLFHGKLPKGVAESTSRPSWSWANACWCMIQLHAKDSKQKVRLQSDVMYVRDLQAE